MKIAFLMGLTVTGRQNGVVSQALTWKSGLETRGVSVDLISPWDTYNWGEYDAIHCFGLGHHLEILPHLKRKGARRIIYSPIYDSNRHDGLANLLSRLAFPVGALRTTLAAVRSSRPYIDKMLVRSDFEAEKITSVFGVAPSNIEKVALPVRFTAADREPGVAREPICSHVSILSAPVKNVARLVEAARRFGFPLHLAGKVNDVAFERWLEGIVRENENIFYHGVLSDRDLRQLYQRSKVFALPSLMEGVGLVGLEAAVCGADIVMTDRGGPKEYYGDLARTVNPESVDEIGNAIMAFLDGETRQPELASHIEASYSIGASIDRLLKVYGGTV